MMGQITNLNMNGLQLEYLTMDKPTEKWEKVSIFSQDDNSLHLLNIPCDRVYDFTKADKTNGNYLPKRRIAGLRFARLTGRQKTILESLISLCTISSLLVENDGV